MYNNNNNNDNNILDNTVRPKFNTLDVRIFSNNNWIPLVPNAREPTAFETDIFKGIAMMVIKTNPLDSLYSSFFQKKATFEIQVQGKFKRPLTGEIYCGGEGTEKLELGMITRSICKAVLQFVATMVSNTHYSFGDYNEINNNIEYEVPHIVAPLMATMDKILVSKPGETLPPLGIPFTEDLNFRKLRLKTRYLHECPIDLDNIYSLSVNTANLDLPEWNMVGVPLVGKYDLRAIFGGGSLRFVAYEVPSSLIKENPDLHPQNKINYMFGIRTTPIDPSNYIDYDVIDNKNKIKDKDTDDNQFIQLKLNNNIGSGSDTEYDNGNDIHDIDDDDDDEEKVDNNEDIEHEPITQEHLTRRTQISNWLRRKVGQKLPSAVADVPETHGEFYSFDIMNEIEDDNKYCFGCIEYNDPKQPSKRRMVYMIPWLNYNNTTSNINNSITSTIKDFFSRSTNHNTNHNTINNNESFNLSNNTLTTSLTNATTTPNIISTTNIMPTVTNTIRLRRYQDFAKLLSLPPIYKKHINKRILIAEKRRKQIIETMKLINRNLNNLSTLNSNISNNYLNIINMLNQTMIYDNNFNDEAFIPLKSSTTKKMGFTTTNITTTSIDGYEGYVMIALSRCHWSQEYMKVNKAEILLIRNPHARRTQIINQIPLSSILCIRQCNSGTNVDVPIYNTNFGFFEIETLNRVYTIMVPNTKQVTDWLQIFQHYLGIKISLISNKLEIIKQWTNSLMENSNSSIFSNHSNHSNNSNNINNKDCSNYLLEILESEQPYVAIPPNCWKLNVRRLYNYRRIIFNTFALQTNKTPCELIESILSKILLLTKLYNKATKNSTSSFFRSRSLSISTNTSITANTINTYNINDDNNNLSGVDSTMLWLEYLDELSLLQTINIIDLKPRDKFCFMLNLYHAMILHGCFILGPPTTWSTWSNFFNSITYLVGYDIISIIELEHNILRKSMTKPLDVMSKLSIPQSQYPEFAIQSRDFRLNFCMINGSESMYKMIPIYHSLTMDAQLDFMTGLYLNEVVQVDISKRLIILPKICSLYLNDFAPMKLYVSTIDHINLNSSPSNTNPNHNNTIINMNMNMNDTIHNVGGNILGTSMHCLIAIVPYLQNELKMNCTRLLTENWNNIQNTLQSNLTIKFLPYIFKCRQLEQYHNNDNNNNTKCIRSNSGTQNTIAVKLPSNSFDTLKDK